MKPFWMTAFLDLPEADHDRGSAFWAAVTGCTPSAPRGDGGEVSTLAPDDGDG